MPETSRPSDAAPAAPVIPYGGFRVVFGLINAALWFALIFAITTPVRLGMVAAGRNSPTAMTLALMGVTLLSALFGLPGALGGFLGQAASGRLKLPPAEKWGAGVLEHIWRTALVRGAAAAVVVGLVAWPLLGRAPVADGSITLVLATVAAAAAFVQSVWISGPAALGDLRSLRRAGPPATSDYFVYRFAVPQAAGNGLASALIAAATFPATGEMEIGASIADATATGTIIFLAMLVTAGGLARLDVQLGRIAVLTGMHPPTWTMRVVVVLVATAGWAGGGSTMAALAGGSVSYWPFVVWKGVLGAVAGGAGALLAARWQLRALVRPASRA